MEEELEEGEAELVAGEMFFLKVQNFFFFKCSTHLARTGGC